MRNRWAATLTAAVLVGSQAFLASPATAQTELGCAPDLPIEARIADATTVFTGTVRTLTNNGRTATVEVIRVWKGGTLPKRVQVTGTIATQSKVITALDRLYARDRAYLFVPSAGATPRFIENRCSATQALTAELSALAPSDGGAIPVGAGVPLPTAGLSKMVPLLIAIPVFLGLGVLLFLARRTTKRAKIAKAS